MKGEWIRKPQSGTSVVFVHGILPTRGESWRHDNGTYWPELLKSEAALQDVGIYVFSYQSDFFSGTYSVGDVVDALKERLRLDELMDSERLVFVCHSMGGIVVRKFVVERASDLKNINIGLFLLASPSLGSEYGTWLAPLAKWLKHAQGDVLKFEQSNTWLNDLDKEFQNLLGGSELAITGKELIEDKFIILKKFLFLKQVVEPFSGARYFPERYKVPGSDHFSIAKPCDGTADQHRLLCKFIKDMLIVPVGDEHLLDDDGGGAPYRLESANEDDISWIANKAKELYGGDSLARDVKLAWFRKNPKCFWIIQADNGVRVGSVEVLPLKPAALAPFHDGKLQESEITAEDIYGPHEADKIDALYIENVMAVGKGNRPLHIAVRQCIRQFDEVISQFGIDPTKVTFYAMPVKYYYSKDGRRSSSSESNLRGLGFDPTTPHTKQGYPLFSAKAVNVLKNLEKYK